MTCGETSAEMYAKSMRWMDEVLADKQVDRANQFAVFYLKDSKVVAVDAVNSPKEFMVCKQLYGKAVDQAALADTEVELKTLLS